MKYFIFILLVSITASCSDSEDANYECIHILDKTLIHSNFSKYRFNTSNVTYEYKQNGFWSYAGDYSMIDECTFFISNSGSEVTLEFFDITETTAKFDTGTYIETVTIE